MPPRLEISKNLIWLQDLRSRSLDNQGIDDDQERAAVKTFLKLTIVGLILAGVSATSFALDKAKARAMFDNNGCASCHQPAETLVGPSLKDIAKRYKGQKVVGEVASRIREGSEGRWGDMPHPAMTTLEPADAELLARWILTGAR